METTATQRAPVLRAPDAPATVIKRLRWAWPAAVNPAAWALAWLVTTFVITRNVKEHFAVFGTSGALVFALLTWLVLTFLYRPNEREPAPRS